MNAYFVDGGDYTHYFYEGEIGPIPEPTRACGIYFAETRGQARAEWLIEYGPDNFEFASKASIRLLKKGVEHNRGQLHYGDPLYSDMWLAVAVVVDGQTVCEKCAGSGCAECWETGLYIDEESKQRMTENA